MINYQNGCPNLLRNYIKLLEKIDRESCRNALDQKEKERILKKQW